MTSNNSELSKVESLNTTSQDNNENSNAFDDSPSATTTDIPSFGWSEYAERVNGRFAMIGFLAVLLIEGLSHSSFLHWAGFIR